MKSTKRTTTLETGKFEIFNFKTCILAFMDRKTKINPDMEI